MARKVFSIFNSEKIKEKTKRSNFDCYKFLWISQFVSETETVEIIILITKDFLFLNSEIV